MRSFKKVDINFPFFLAPMVGLSHVAMRALVQKYTPKDAKTLWPTEMLNSRRLPSQVLGETPETLLCQTDSNLMPQILGNEEKFIGDSVIKLKDWGAVAIDINMGCPVKKALKHNYGVSLMGDPNYAAEVVKMTVSQTDLPVSVKTRAGESKNIDELLKFVNLLTDSGASWITLHPRSPKEKRKGDADWNLIKELHENTEVPIIGNGDVQNLEDALLMREITGCDGVMIGRAMTARPWLLWQIGKKLGFSNPEGIDGEPPESPEEEAYFFGKTLIEFIDYCEEYFDQNYALRKVRFYIKNNHGWLNFGQRLVSIAGKTDSFDEMKKEIRKFFTASGLKMNSRTNLRY